MKKILVVDDNVINLKIAERFIKMREDYKPVLVPSGAKALQFLGKNKPDMILLDILMPEKDGYQVLGEIKQNSELADIPVLFLTADEDPQIEEKVKASGAQGFIRKPFKQEDLLELIDRFMGGEA